MQEESIGRKYYKVIADHYAEVSTLTYATIVDNTIPFCHRGCIAGRISPYSLQYVQSRSLTCSLTSAADTIPITWGLCYTYHWFILLFFMSIDIESPCCVYACSKTNTAIKLPFTLTHHMLQVRQYPIAQKYYILARAPREAINMFIKVCFGMLWRPISCFAIRILQN